MTEPHPLKIAIYIPAYNAAYTLPVVLDRIPAEIKEKVRKIFVVDNASPDNTHLIGIGYREAKGLDKLEVFRCAALAKIPFELCSNDYHFDTDIIIQFKIKGLRIVEMPIPTYYGKEKCGVNVVSYGLNVLKSMTVYWLWSKGLLKIPMFDDCRRAS